jgi:hypothetical protein
VKLAPDVEVGALRVFVGDPVVVNVDDPSPTTMTPEGPTVQSTYLAVSGCGNPLELDV